MRILVLTPINPVWNQEVYSKILKKHKSKDVLCFPFFAEMRSQLNDQAYIPTYFAMIKTSLDKDMQRKLYNRKNMIVIGNTYKEQKFDMIVALKEDIDSEYFDSYIKELETNPELKDFAEKVDIKNLYNIEDAEIILPTINHLLLFLEGAFEKDEEKNKLKQ